MAATELVAAMGAVAAGATADVAAAALLCIELLMQDCISLPKMHNISSKTVWRRGIEKEGMMLYGWPG